MYSQDSNICISFSGRKSNGKGRLPTNTNERGIKFQRNSRKIKKNFERYFEKQTKNIVRTVEQEPKPMYTYIKDLENNPSPNEANSSKLEKISSAEVNPKSKGEHFNNFSYFYSYISMFLLFLIFGHFFVF